MTASPYAAEPSVVQLSKFTARTLTSRHPATLKRRTYLESLDYKVFGHAHSGLDPSQPIFTIIVTVYDGKPEFVQATIDSVLSQSYSNTEIVIVDNGSTGPVAEIVRRTFLSTRSSKVIHVSEHMYNPLASDFEDPIPNLWNAGLFASVGDYVYFLSYDDVLSSNYVQSMVSLFVGNPHCTSAAPRVVSIDVGGSVNEVATKRLDAGNVRGRYTSGIQLARGRILGNEAIIAPGGLLAQQSSVVLDSGGFDVLNDFTQIFRFAIQGDSGFDPSATLSWRHHEGQANKKQKRMGLVYYALYSGLSERYALRELHTRVAGEDFANEFDRYWAWLTLDMALSSVRDSTRGYGLRSGGQAVVRLFSEAPVLVALRGVAVALRATPYAVCRAWFPSGLDYWLHIRAHFRRRVT